MARAAGPTVALDGGFEHGDGGEAKHGRFAGERRSDVSQPTSWLSVCWRTSVRP
ncbi:MAG: hypothetical protein HWD60_14565 [Defluviicoccus sp.]|nr:MAG: hypothetical protein HWD60_14565 [Defluviicoccus sp.]